MKDRLPFMSIFVGDYVGSISVHLMTLAERGTYVQEGAGPVRRSRSGR